MQNKWHKRNVLPFLITQMIHRERKNYPPSLTGMRRTRSMTQKTLNWTPKETYHWVMSPAFRILLLNIFNRLRANLCQCMNLFSAKIEKELQMAVADKIGDLESKVVQTWRFVKNPLKRCQNCNASVEHSSNTSPNSKSIMDKTTAAVAVVSPGNFYPVYVDDCIDNVITNNQDDFN